jgi:hypothetical protein
MNTGWQGLGGVVVVMQCNADLLQVIFALASSGGFPGLLNSGEQ